MSKVTGVPEKTGPVHHESGSPLLGIHDSAIRGSHQGAGGAPDEWLRDRGNKGAAGPKAYREGGDLAGGGTWRLARALAARDARADTFDP
jgi:hypothetical protein